MTDKVCESPDCPGNVSAGFRLCVECRREVRRELRALPGLYRDCAWKLSNTPQGMVPRISRTRPVGISLNEAAVRVRADVLDILSAWCALVVSERGVAGPADRAVDELAAFLDRNLVWLAAHPAAGDLAAELHGLTEAACDVADNASGETRTLGRCDRSGCGQTVFMTRTPEGGGHRVRCAAGHAWQPHEWLLLSRRMATVEVAA
jgi:hypothetical protein